MTPKEALRRSALFSQLSDREIEEVVGILSERKATAGETLIREGEEAYSLFILEEGAVDVLRNTEQGQSARITELGQGAMFGEMSFVEHAPVHHVHGHPARSAGIVAHGDAKVLELRYDALERLAEADPVLGVKLYRTLAVSLNEKLKSTTDHLLPLISSARMAALGQMTANIAHELNNPLAVLRTLSERIAEHIGKPDTDAAEVKSWAEKIGSTVMRISKLISGLRSVSRDGAGDPLVPVDPAQIVHETLEFCEQRLRLFEIKTELRIADDRSMIRCRSVQISQAILNLLNNSMDALSTMQEPHDRWIRIEVQKAGHDIMLSVTDSGVGIPSDLTDRIFRPFFTTKGLGCGTGLGLSISRQLVEANGGALALDTASKQTRFVIRMPCASPNPADPAYKEGL
jgi:signal transduction histidine kinase